MPVEKYLALSSGHITPSDGRLLDRYDADDPPFDGQLSAWRYESGWFISTSFILEADQDAIEETLGAIKGAGFSDAFMAVLRRAREGGCCLIRLDGAAEEEHGMMVFDW